MNSYYKGMETPLRIILALLGLFFLLNGAFVSTIINFNVGILTTLCLGIFALLWAFFWNFLKSQCQAGWKKWVYRFVIFGFAAYLGCMGLIGLYGLKDTATYTEDAVIVLGAGIRGEKVTRVLQFRLDTAYAYYEKNPNALFIVSGGQGSGESISEALAMSRYLVQKGIPQNQIILEDQSTSTLENFKFSKALLDKYFDKDYKVVFTTNNFHIFRANLMANHTGFNATHLHAPIDAYMMPVVYTREVLALLKYCLLESISR